MRLFCLKLFVFIFLVLAVQLFLPVSRDIPNEIKLLDVYAKLKAEIIYFGDSTINWASPSDISQESMSGLLQRLLPHVRVAKLTHASYQPDVYAAFAEYIARKGYNPRFVIIPVNLRSFSPEWDRQPLWQFEKEKLTLAMKDTWMMKFYRPLAVFKFFDPAISRFDYDQTPVFIDGKFAGRVRDYDNPDYREISEEKMKKKLIFRYMYTLTARHRKVLSLVHAAAVFKSAGIEPVFYITPVDIQAIERVLGPASVGRVANNVGVIRTALAGQNAQLLDLSTALPGGEFCWPADGDGPRYPNEHLKLRGRMLVVKSLSERTSLDQLNRN